MASTETPSNKLHFISASLRKADKHKGARAPGKDRRAKLLDEGFAISKLAKKAKNSHLWVVEIPELKHIKISGLDKSPSMFVMSPYNLVKLLQTGGFS